MAGLKKRSTQKLGAAAPPRLVTTTVIVTASPETKFNLLGVKLKLATRSGAPARTTIGRKTWLGPVTGMKTTTVLSLALLLAGTGSLTPLGNVTVAVLINRPCAVGEIK